MLFGKKRVNINNYSEIFKNYSKDIKEVIRSAILDDTPIAPYIERFKNNPYMLWQVKMSLDEGLNARWYDIIGSGRVLYNLRDMNRRGINIKPLMRYFSKGLSDSHCEYIIKWYKEGYALEKYNFDILPENLLEYFDYGIKLGYPMYLFNNGVNFKKEYLMCCLKILSNSKNINNFLDGTWNIENLELLSKYSKSKYYDKLIQYITKEITPSVLEELFKCCKVGMPFDDIASIDKEGLYIYSGVHISLIREAFINDWNYKSLLDTSLSINDIHSLLSSMKYSSMKKVSGRLRKN